MSKQLDNLLARLNGVKNNGFGKYMACCPAHDDKSPSLAIKEVDNGRLLIKCWAGCGFLEIIQAIGLNASDLFPPTDIKIPHKKNHQRFNKSDLFDRLLNASMVMMIMLNSTCDNPLESPGFFKEEITEEDFKRVLLSMKVTESIYLEVKRK
jgi:hypothetical protein